MARSTFRSQKWKKLKGSEHFWMFGCRFAWQARGILHLAKSQQNMKVCSSFSYKHRYTTPHYTTLQLQQQVHYTTLIALITLITLHYTPLQQLHYHYTHCTPLHFTTQHYTQVHYTTTTTTTATTLHYTRLIPLHDATLHYATTATRTTLHYAKLIALL